MGNRHCYHWQLALQFRHWARYSSCAPPNQMGTIHFLQMSLLVRNCLVLAHISHIEAILLTLRSRLEVRLLRISISCSVMVDPGSRRPRKAAPTWIGISKKSSMRRQKETMQGTASARSLRGRGLPLSLRLKRVKMHKEEY
jgi:hypothetical protein